MRLKNYSLKKKILIGRKIKKICKSSKVKFIVNDNPWLAKKLTLLLFKTKFKLCKKELFLILLGDIK